jgi:hypothetical protein
MGINLTDLRKIWCDSVDWIHLAQDRTSEGAVVDTLMTFGFHKRRGIS